MQFITRAVRVDNNNLLRNVSALINGNLSRPSSGTTNVADKTLSDQMEKVSGWMKYNEKVYPPQDPSEPPRPAYVCYEVKNAKYSPKKMWYVACFVRGMSVEEALKQLQCLKSKGSLIVKEAIENAVDLAINEHNVEFKSNLWVAESFCGKGITLKGLRRHARGRITMIRYRYVNYYVRLEEGQPPKDYYCKGHLTDGSKLLEKWFTEMRGRKINNTL